MIELTKKETELLADYIEDTIFAVIRDDVEIDNISWLINIIDIYKKCEAGAENDK